MKKRESFLVSVSFRLIFFRSFLLRRVSFCRFPIYSTKEKRERERERRDTERETTTTNNFLVFVFVFFYIFFTPPPFHRFL